jgi:hypothetical protein
MNNTDQFTTDFLFTTPSFLTGASNVLNLAGGFFEYNRSKSETEADCTAIANDFNIVGSDLKKAMRKITSNTEV